MPAIAEGIYAQYYDSVIKMAKRPGGVSRPEIMKGCAVTRPAADKIIDGCRLKRARTEGRTEFFTPTKATAKVLGAQDESSGQNDTQNDQNGDGKDSTTMVNQAATQDPATTADQPATGQNRIAGLKFKSKEELDQEILAIRKAIDDAEEKAKNGHKTYVVQSAHAQALGAKLQRVLEARLEL